MISPGGITEHVEHAWVKRGRCVYCHKCDVVLFQGNVPRNKKMFAKAFEEVASAAIKAVVGRREKRKK